MNAQKKRTSVDRKKGGKDPKHICERCGKGFTEDYRRKLHIQFFCAFGPGKNRKNCDPDTPRICYICSAPFRTAKMMRRHLIRDCRTKMRYQCQMCNYESHWAFMYQKHMSRVHHELMEVIDSVMKEQQSQQCAGEEEEERMEVYGQEVGDEEEMRNMEDRVIVENYELGAEYDEKSMVEAENEVGAGYEEESMIEAENEVGIENEDHLEDQFVEREENQIGSELGSISGADTIIDLTNSEEYELGDVDEITRLENMKENGTESKKENFRDLAAATSVINDTKSETENISRKEMETDNTETQESTNRLYLEDLEKKQMFKEKVYENLSKKSKALPTFQFDFVKPVKMTMDSSSRDHSETKIKTHKERKIEKRRHSEKENYCKKKREENKKKKRDSGDTKIKTHKERKIEKRRHSEKENYCRKKREENKKKKRDSGDKKKAHNGRCSHSNDNAMNEQKTVVETEKRNEEAVVPTMNIGLDSWLEGLLQSGLPRMSDEDFERLKASDPIFQFLVVNLS